MGKALRELYLRIDARSLGLFRILFATVLIGDLFRRWCWLKEFYSNDGVLPNHNHIFLLHDKERFWSVFNAFSSTWENHFAFGVALVVYVLFLVGHKTRAFHALSIVVLVSLGGRNILLENAGNYAAVALLAFTLFLPCGSSFSLDSFRRSLHETDEKNALALNDRNGPSFEELLARRGPGFSPASIASLAILLQIAIIYACTAAAQSGSWRDGTAVYYAINNIRMVSAIGLAARSLPPALLSAWTRALYASEWLVPLLALVPFAPRFARGGAALLSVFFGLSIGLLLDLGLFGWTLVAAAALLIPRATWERWAKPKPSKLRTVIYDADCGVCLWLTRVLKRIDLRGHLAFQGNDSIEELLVRNATGAVEGAAMPAAVTTEVVQDSVVVVDAKRHVETRGRAVAAVFDALPFGWTFAWVMRLPGIVNLLNLAYDFVAQRRQRISVLMGKAACGIPLPPEPEEHATDEAGGEPAVGANRSGSEPIRAAPATRVFRFVTGTFREGLALVGLLAMVAQTGVSNDVPKLIPLVAPLDAVAGWPRMLARWDALTPEPLHTDEVLVIDAQTRAGRSIDPLHGGEPIGDPGSLQDTRLGQLWGDYLTRIHEKEWLEFQRSFRDYLGRGGPRWEAPQGDDVIGGYDVYWLKQQIPEPGQARDEHAVTREKMFTFSRGGRMLDPRVPLIRPGTGAKR